MITVADEVERVKEEAVFTVNRELEIKGFKAEVVQLKKDSERLKRTIFGLKTIHANELCIQELANTKLQTQLKTANKRLAEYREACIEAREAIRTNLAYERVKNEEVLLDAFNTIEKALRAALHVQGKVE